MDDGDENGDEHENGNWDGNSGVAPGFWSLESFALGCLSGRLLGQALIHLVTCLPTEGDLPLMLKHWFRGKK